jgi:hypothetical protein
VPVGIDGVLFFFCHVRGVACHVRGVACSKKNSFFPLFLFSFDVLCNVCAVAGLVTEKRSIFLFFFCFKK